MFNEAKKIFEKYKGNYFQMDRDNILEIYKSYHVPQKLEKEWINDQIFALQDDLKECLNKKKIVEDMELLGHYVSISKNKKGLYYMIQYIDDKKEIIDSNTLLRCINACISNMNFLKEKDRQVLIGKLVWIIKTHLKNDVFISDDYKIDGKFPDYLTTERVKEALCNLINYWA